MGGKIRSQPPGASSRRKRATPPPGGGTSRRSTSRSGIPTSGSKSTSRTSSNTRARSSTTRNSWRCSRFRSPRRSPGCARGRSPTPRPSRDCSGLKKYSAESGARALKPISEFDPGFARVVFRLEGGLAESDRLHVGVLDVPVMHPGAERQVILFEHQVGAVSAAPLLGVGHIVEAEVRVAELGLLFP